jgi:hypothetical protein
MIIALLSLALIMADTGSLYRTEIDRMALSGESEKIFRVEDSLGNLILETDDYSMIRGMKNIRLKILPVPKKIIVLKDPADFVRGILSKKLGAPYRMETWYTATWRTPQGGTIILNKQRGSDPILIASYRAREWMRENLKSMKNLGEDTAKVSRGDTVSIIKNDTMKDKSRTLGLPEWLQEKE